MNVGQLIISSLQMIKFIHLAAYVQLVYLSIMQFCLMPIHLFSLARKVNRTGLKFDISEITSSALV